MRCNSAKHACVFVLHFTLNDSIPKRNVIGRGGNCVAPRGRGNKYNSGNSESSKFGPAECVEGCVGQTFEGNSENDESNIAVGNTRSGISDQRSGECCA